jgi:hypothetical protein
MTPGNFTYIVSSLSPDPILAFNIPGGKVLGVALTNSAGVPLGIGAGGEQIVSAGGSTTASVPSGAANTVVKATAGRLCKAIVTTAGTGTGSVLVYDNATTNSGTVIGVVPATIAIGTVYDFQFPAANGITVTNVANGPVLTISFD